MPFQEGLAVLQISRDIVEIAETIEAAAGLLGIGGRGDGELGQVELSGSEVAF